MDRKTSEQDLVRQMLEDAEHISVPDSLKPEAVRKTLEETMRKQTANEQQEALQRQVPNGQKETLSSQDSAGQTTGTQTPAPVRRKSPLRRLAPALAAAACLLCAAGLWKFGPLRPEKLAPQTETGADEQAAADGIAGQTDADADAGGKSADTSDSETEGGTLPQAAASYDEIYQTIHTVQARREALRKQYASDYDLDGGIYLGTEELAEAAPADAAAPAAGTAQENGASTGGGLVKNETQLSETMADAVTTDSIQGEDGASFSTTNVQVEAVDEEDMVKTDGSYLYHLVRDYSKGSDCSISIVKADGSQMEEVSRIEGLDSINGFYLQGDSLVCVEQLWLETTVPGQGGFLKRLAGGATYDSYPRSVVRISFFDITDRSHPKKVSSLTTDGYAASSRISGGYFYLISQYTPYRSADPEDPDTFIPIVNGMAMAAASIIIPENADTDSYLVVASVSLEDPTKFADSKAILSGGNQYYVSTDHIYVADTQYRTADTDASTTNLTVFSYKDGQITGQKSGTVKGEILDPFAMNEYNGYFRVVTTVDSYDVVEITDDLTGEFLGYNYENETRTNSLYVLDGNLQVVGKIEGLAEDEQVYSARFMGDTGYFVTFKQIDPLFSVDLSDPHNPKILGELKISGFSEYLHFYDENLLLGIGREVDPDTLSSEGLKLSMFDISDPSDVKEIDKVVFEEINYSEAYYDYKSVLIDPEKNLFGFPCEADIDDTYVRQYRTFSYDPEKGFTEGICWTEDEDSWTQARGAFIDKIFYILQDDGNITAYHLGNNQKVGALEMKKEEE